MKTLLALALISISTMTKASEIEFHCQAKFLGDTQHVLSGTITSDSTLSDVVYSIKGEEQFEASLLKKDRNYRPKKYGYYQQMIMASGTWIEGSSTEYAILMPEKMTELNRFEAIVRSLNDQGGNYTKLECFVEN